MVQLDELVVEVLAWGGGRQKGSERGLQLEA
jgi:hypothetical protein